MREIARRLSGRRLRRQSSRVWSATYILMGLRWPRPLTEELFRRVRSMKESVTYQAILEEGEAKGQLAEAKRLLRLQGESRFGPPDKPSVLALEAIPRLENPPPKSREPRFVRSSKARTWSLSRPEWAAEREPARRP